MLTSSIFTLKVSAERQNNCFVRSFHCCLSYHTGTVIDYILMMLACCRREMLGGRLVGALRSVRRPGNNDNNDSTAYSLCYSSMLYATIIHHSIK
jgi:hypothetical protein